VRYKGHIRHFGHQTMGRGRVLRGARSALTGAESLQDASGTVLRGSVGVVELQVFRGKVCSGGGSLPGSKTPTAVTLAFMRRQERPLTWGCVYRVSVTMPRGSVCIVELWVSRGPVCSGGGVSLPATANGCLRRFEAPEAPYLLEVRLL
jgi:hypothetical protein